MQLPAASGWSHSKTLVRRFGAPPNRDADLTLKTDNALV